MATLQENNTHKAIKENGKINIYIKGMAKDSKAPDGTLLFDDNDIEKYPDWFKDEFLYSIPLENEDDLFSMFEGFDETNRINLAEFNQA